MKSFLVSIVVPIFNEEKNVLPLLKRLIPQLKNLHYEVVFVDDGSTDSSVVEIRKATEENKSIKLVRFNRNFGHQNALSAGYVYAKGDCVISMDADLQDPPELVPQMIESWKNGSKIVYAKRRKRTVDSWFKVSTARAFYSFINSLSDVPIPRDVGDFRLIDRVVVEFLTVLPEHSRFLRGLVAWTGFPSTYVEYDREDRHTGTTHYPFSKMVAFAFDAITSFSTKPLKIASYCGFVTAAFGFVGIVYAILGRMFLPAYWVSGWTALFVAILFLGGVQLITIGIVGEYIEKIYIEIQNRPMYLVAETINI
jgi:polyisoprenyl-phosphate glycosyltransferase